MAVAISLGFLVLLAAFAVLGEWALHDSTNRILDERLVIAQMVASQLDGLLQEAITELKQANRFADFDLADPDLSADTDMLAHTYGRVGLFASGIVLLDPSGVVIVSHPPDLYPPGLDLTGLPHITQALEGRGVTISDGFNEPLNHRPVAAVTVPLYEGSLFLGLLSGLIDLSDQAIVTPLQQSATLGHTGHAALVDRQGRTLVSTFDLPFLSPGEHVTFYRQAMTQRQPVIETVPFELDLPGEPKDDLHVMAFAPMQRAPWGVAVGGDLDETFAGVSRLRLGLAMLSIIAAASVWTATLIGARRPVRAVQRLMEAAQRIANGDLQTPIESPDSGEIGRMAVALERMRRQLLTNIEKLANWNKSLEAHVAKQTEEIRQQQALTQQLLRRAITAQEEERAHLSREMHDGVGQMLTAVELSLDRLAKFLPVEDHNAQERLERARTLIGQALTDLRRIIAALRPGVLDQLGLAPALRWLGEHLLRPLGISVTIEIEGLQERLPGEIETILFRIAQEAMSNVARHSQAGHVNIQVRYDDGQVTMTLTDDGQGYDLAAISPPVDHSRGLGLASMQERASLAGGRVTIESQPGQGSAVHVVVPLPEKV
jgi:signal transduction histidine kinase